MIRILLTLIILLAATQATALTITLREQAEVDTTTITLGDIATFDEQSDLARALASQAVAKAPSPGQKLRLDSDHIASNLTKRLPDSQQVAWRGASTISVSRASTEVSSDKVLAIVTTYIKNHLNAPKSAKVKFTPAARPIPFTLPAGRLSWKVIPSNPNVMASNRFSVIFSVDGRVRRNMSVRGQLEVIVPTVVLRTTVARGEILSPNHLALAEMGISNLRDPLLDIDEVVGKKLLSSRRAGQPLAKHHIEYPPVIKRGEVVRMVLIHGPLQLTTLGIARSNGHANETIRVQNAASNKIVYCRVTAPGFVEVVL